MVDGLLISHEPEPGPRGPVFRHPWPQHAERAGHVHVYRPPGHVPTAISAAKAWAHRNGYTFEYRELGGVLLTRFTRKTDG